jgi:hypothetical protein
MNEYSQERAKCMWKDSEHRTQSLTGQGSANAGKPCKGGWDDD